MAAKVQQFCKKHKLLYRFLLPHHFLVPFIELVPRVEKNGGKTFLLYVFRWYLYIISMHLTMLSV